MATVDVRGYVNGPEAKTSGNGNAFSKFRLSHKQVEKAWKDNPEKVTYATFFVTDRKNGSPPPEGAYVNVKGFLKVNEVERDGVKKTYLEVNAQELEVIGTGNGGAGGAGKKPAQTDKDPWDE